MKMLVETKGGFQLLDLGYKGQLIHSHRPSVAENSHFVQDRIGRDQVRVLGELKDEATDEDFVKYLEDAEGDLELAIDSFLSEFGKETVETPGKRRRGKKSEATENEADA